MNSYCELENGSFTCRHMIISSEMKTALQVFISVFFGASHLLKTPAFGFHLFEMLHYQAEVGLWL